MVDVLMTIVVLVVCCCCCLAKPPWSVLHALAVFLVLPLLTRAGLIIATR